MNIDQKWVKKNKTAGISGIFPISLVKIFRTAILQNTYELEAFQSNIYLFKVNNKYIRKSVKYAQI